MAEDKEVNYIKDIKSVYIKKEIFSYLNIKVYLDMIIYNKELQQMFGVNIEDYKKISKKYLIFENGKVKEYTRDNILIYEGEYLKRKRNGKGKEYFEFGEVSFEGEYLNGERNGKGKEYYRSGDLLLKVNI